MSKKILRLLVVDDYPDDADALARNLRIARFMLKSHRVVDAPGLQDALKDNKWDVVVSEFNLKAFNARLALDVVRNASPNTPFIVYTKGISDDEMTDIMNAGARDVVNKSRPARIVPAIERELATAEYVKEYDRAMQAMKQLEHKLEAMANNPNDAVSYVHDGVHIDANQNYLDLFGYENLEELEIVPALNLIDKDDHHLFKDYLRKVSKGIEVRESPEFKATRKDGKRIDIEISAGKVTHNNHDCIQIKVNDISKRKMAEDRLHYLSQHDPLTGLYNRHYFAKLLGDVIGEAREQQTHSALLFVDLYDLVAINSEMGYTAGDLALVKISSEFKELLGENAIIARISGDAFTILLTNQGEAVAKNTAADIEARLHNLVLNEHGKTHSCSCVICINMVTSESGDAHELLDQGVRQCEEKRPKPAAVVQSTAPEPVAVSTADITPDTAPVEAPVPAPQPEVAVMSELGKDIARALIDNRFRLFYQPIIDLQGGGNEKFEVYIRMISANGEILTPDKFLDEAEKTGQMQAIDRWVADAAIRSMAALHNEGRRTRFFINLSVQAYEDSGLSPIIKQALNETLVDPQYAVFEIDAPELAERSTIIHQMVSDICELGCSISLDNSLPDLSTALSLPRHSVRFIKLAADTISKTMSNNASKETMMSMMEMARKLDIEVIAKGIEDAGNLPDIWSSGIQYVQGDYFQPATDDLDFEFDTGDEAELSSDTSSW
ncbi:MAG: EAL domain-containing protein [Gammaproteobacteria bacterium]|nr:EAL domain-containing protein [Gammaproteobacteria bacterium]